MTVTLEAMQSSRAYKNAALPTLFCVYGRKCVLLQCQSTLLWHFPLERLGRTAAVGVPPAGEYIVDPLGLANVLQSSEFLHAT